MTAWLMSFFGLLGMRTRYDMTRLGNDCMMNVFLFFSLINGFSMAQGYIWVVVC
jgi:hypothetical protein